MFRINLKIARYLEHRRFYSTCPVIWSEAEIDAIVEDYFDMLALELEGRR